MEFQGGGFILCHVVFRKKKIYNNDFNCNKGAILTKCVEKNTLSQNMLHLGQNGLYVLCLLTIRTTVHQRVFFFVFLIMNTIVLVF